MIYVLEDEESIRNLMLYTLRSGGLEAEGFGDSEPFWGACKVRRPSLVLLDIMLPGEDGLTVLKRLRAGADTRRIPVIMTTAKGSEYDKVLGLDLGADDYLAKPFGMLEMLSRVRAVLRRTQGEADARLRLGDLEMDLGSHRVWAAGEEIQPTRKEYDLLRLMMEAPGRVFTREELLDRVWDAEYAGETRTVDVHIQTLRAKLGPCGAYVKTLRGVGYKMEAAE